jgi:hypothetical protein
MDTGCKFRAEKDVPTGSILTGELALMGIQDRCRVLAYSGRSKQLALPTACDRRGIRGGDKHLITTFAH